MHCHLFRLTLDLHDACHADVDCSPERHAAALTLVADAAQATQCAVCLCGCCCGSPVTEKDKAFAAGFDWAALVKMLKPLIEAILASLLTPTPTPTKGKGKAVAKVPVADSKVYAADKAGAADCCCDLFGADVTLLEDQGMLYAASRDCCPPDVLQLIECVRLHVLCSLDNASKIHCDCC